jgi:cell division protein FtsB
MDTLGSLVDKLTVVNLKLWHQEELAHDPVANDAVVAEAKRKINVLNNQRNALIEEIDDLFLDILEGRKKMTVFRQCKDYSKR